MRRLCRFVFQLLAGWSIIARGEYPVMRNQRKFSQEFNHRPAGATE
jgi:hypothetical protein